MKNLLEVQFTFTASVLDELDIKILSLIMEFLDVFTAVKLPTSKAMSFGNLAKLMHICSAFY